MIKRWRERRTWAAAFGMLPRLRARRKWKQLMDHLSQQYINAKSHREARRILELRMIIEAGGPPP